MSHDHPHMLKFWDLHNEPVSAVNPAAAGDKNVRAYCVGSNLVLKLSSQQNEVKTAVALYSAAHGAGVRMPSLIKTTGGKLYAQEEGLYAYVIRRLPGRPLTASDFFAGDCAAKARTFGESLGQLHLVLSQIAAHVKETDLRLSVRNWALPIAKNLLPLSEQWCQKFVCSLEDLCSRLPRQIIHRDPNPANVIASPDGWGFIDFELAEINVRIYDPCCAALAILSESFTGFDQTRLSQWLEICSNILRGYDSAAELTEAEWAALPYVIAAHQLECAVWCSEQKRNPRMLETNTRIALWLIENWDRLKFQPNPTPREN